LYQAFHRNYRAAQASGFWESLLDALNHPPPEPSEEPGGVA
jgi:hypothetical protein